MNENLTKQTAMAKAKTVPPKSDTKHPAVTNQPTTQPPIK
jgi:hypothetical protein